MQPSILLVDDETDFLSLLSRQLAEAGYKVQTAEDDLAALYLYDETSPDMVILDIRFGLEQRLGLDILKAIRRDRGDTTTPVLMLTSLSTPDTREQVEPRSFDLGATDFLSPNLLAPRGCWRAFGRDYRRRCAMLSSLTITLKLTRKPKPCGVTQTVSPMIEIIGCYEKCVKKRTKKFDFNPF